MRNFISSIVGTIILFGTWHLLTLTLNWTLCPSAWAYCSTLADERAQLAAYGFIKCGTTQASNTFLACVASAALSLLAVGCGVVSLCLLPGPRPKLQTLEVIAMSVPLVAAVAF